MGLMDVKHAFVNAKISEELYVEQPEGFEVTGSQYLVYRFRKALYRLRQSSRNGISTCINFLFYLDASNHGVIQLSMCGVKVMILSFFCVTWMTLHYS